MSTYSEEEESETLLQRATNAALRPIQILVSPPAIKAYLSTLLFLFTSFVLLAVSTTAFLFFYYAYIPQVDLSRVLYMQYGTPGYTHPFAHTQLETSALTSNQPYDITIDIHLPRTPSNLHAGNFMLDLSLLSPPSTPPSVPAAITTMIPNTTTTIAQSRRPAILPYTSPILSLYQTIINIPLHFLGLHNPDATTLHIPMFERISFARGYRNIPTALTLSIQTQSHSAIPLQIYSASITFQARFQGLRWFVYNNRIISWILFSAIFYTLAISTMAITWAVVSYLIFPKKAKTTTLLKTEPASNGHAVKAEASSGGGGKRIKTEKEEDESSLDAAIADFSDTPTQFPTLSKQMPLRFPVEQQQLRSDNSGRSPTKREQDTTIQETAIEPLTAATAEDAADDEEEEEEEKDDEQHRGFDSGIGTSMESENVPSGVVRRRSNRSLRGKD